MLSLIHVLYRVFCVCEGTRLRCAIDWVCRSRENEDLQLVCRECERLTNIRTCTSTFRMPRQSSVCVPHVPLCLWLFAVCTLFFWIINSNSRLFARALHLLIQRQKLISTHSILHSSLSNYHAAQLGILVCECDPSARSTPSSNSHASLSSHLFHFPVFFSFCSHFSFIFRS